MSKLIDLKNKRFGFWVVLERAENAPNGQIRWKCLCECGKEKLVTANSLRSGNSTSCGCNHTPDLINETFDQLKVISLAENKIKNRRYWLCKCTCGNEITLSTNQLRNKQITSCGHDAKDSIKSIECYVKMLIPYSKMKNIIKSALVVYDLNNIPKLLINIE